jgi:EAL domain-containing protein (putative c-di-GMP-specific phosphodiesterase class I)
MVRRNLIETELRKAIRDTSFLLFFQPKMDIRERKVVSTEALLRWPLSRDEWVSPAEFIPVAEQTDLILPIGSWVIRTAVEFLRALHDLGYSDITMGINVSPKQFLTPGFIEEIETIIEKNEISPSSIILEITEHVLMHDVRYSKEILRKLRDLGFHISIDDFGTGYSSLSYLKEFPVSEIKIDRSFIQDLPDSRHASAITRSLIAVASTLDYSIVAEGVETEKHAEFLQNHRCHIGQGYLYSKPLPKQEFIEFLRHTNVPGRTLE